MQLDIGRALCAPVIWLAGWRCPKFLDRPVTIVALVALHVYRALLSRFSGRTCMFSTSCSQYGLKTISIKGWRNGCGDLAARLRRCDGKYTLTAFNGRLTMLTSDGLEFEESEISAILVDSFYSSQPRFLAVEPASEA